MGKNTTMGKNTVTPLRVKKSDLKNLATTASARPSCSPSKTPASENLLLQKLELISSKIESMENNITTMNSKFADLERVMLSRLDSMENKITSLFYDLHLQ